MCTSIPTLPRGSLRASNPVREGHWYIREGRIPSPKVSAVANAIGTPLGSAQPVRDVTPGSTLHVIIVRGRTRPHFARGDEHDQSRPR